MSVEGLDVEKLVLVNHKKLVISLLEMENRSMRNVLRNRQQKYVLFWACNFFT